MSSDRELAVAMHRIAFVLKLTGEREAQIEAVRAMRSEFEAACTCGGVSNFSIWHIQQYLFGYGETENGDMSALDAVLGRLPECVELACAPGSMRLMYHNIGVVREDKRLIRHRVFSTRIKPGCEDEYKRRHDVLVEARGDCVSDGPESDFTIWYGDGHIFGYCELVRALADVEPTPEQKAATVAWETRQLEIMDWLTDDVDWLTGEKHPKVERVL